MFFLILENNTFALKIRPCVITVLVTTSVLRWVLLLPTHYNNLSLVMLDKINHWHHYLVYIEFWGLVRSNNFTQHLIYVVKRVMFITVLVITSVLRWVLWLPTHQNNLSLVMLEKINHWQHYILVYIEFWGMVRSNNFAQNIICVVKRVMFITVFVITSVLIWVIWLPTHQNKVSLVMLEKINHWQHSSLV